MPAMDEALRVFPGADVVAIRPGASAMIGDRRTTVMTQGEPVEGFVVERALVGAARALSAQLTVEGVCSATLEAVEQVFKATSAWVMLYDAASKTLRTAVFRGVGADVYRDARIPVDDRWISGVAFSRRQVVFVPDVKEEPRWFDAERMYATGLRSLFMLPLVFGDEVLGVVALDAPRFGPDTGPSANDIELLEALAGQAAVAIKNARLFEASERDRDRLRELLRQQRQLSGQIHQLRKEVRAASGGGRFIGESEEARHVLHQADLVARGDTTVLLLGETGTGKDLLARFIHDRSRRSSGPFVAVNCAAMPDTLVESELFGHEKGAFTGAVARKPGSFEAADGGTIFLDEIGDLPLDAQAKLLRVLQDRQVQRIGATRLLSVNVRVIAATNHDLEKGVLDKQFRPDLFYRISVFPIRVPALRDRPSDIPLLVEHFLKHFADRLGKDTDAVTADAQRLLVEYAWPGNVRELQNVIERAVILSRGGEISTDDLFLPPPAIARALDAPTEPSGSVHQRYGPTTFADAERQAILTALHLTGWRISGSEGAASRLGLKPTTLHAKMKKLGIRRPTSSVPAVDPAARNK